MNDQDARDMHALAVGATSAHAMNTSPVKESLLELPDKFWCETCEGSGMVGQEHQAGCWVGGDFKCPDCDGKGYWMRKVQAIAAPREGWVMVPSTAQGTGDAAQIREFFVLNATALFWGSAVVREIDAILAAKETK